MYEEYSTIRIPQSGENTICSCHFEDENLRRHIERSGESGTCSFCGKNGKVIDFADFIRHVNNTVYRYFGTIDEENLPLDFFHEDNYGFGFLRESGSNIANYNLNKGDESRPTIENSIGIVMMMILISGSAIVNFLIEDEEQDTKTRVLVSGIPQYKYYLALLIVFYLLSSISSIIYYSLCKFLNLDFGMNNTNNFLIVMLLLNLVAISLNLFIVSFTRNRYIASTVNILIVIPSCMFSGVFWDFNVMPDYLQRIGKLMPQRLVYKAIEKLQVYNSLSYIKEYILYMILISFIFFFLSLPMFNTKKAN